MRNEDIIVLCKEGQCAWGISFTPLDYFSVEMCLQSALWSDPGGGTAHHSYHRSPARPPNVERSFRNVRLRRTKPPTPGIKMTCQYLLPQRPCQVG